MVDQLAYLYTAIACITTMRDQICLASCKFRFSSDTWLASAMVSFSCWGLLVSVRLWSSSATYIDLSNVSRDCWP